MLPHSTANTAAPAALVQNQEKAGQEHHDGDVAYICQEIGEFFPNADAVWIFVFAHVSLSFLIVFL